MPAAPTHAVTRLLERHRDGDPDALGRMLPLVYHELQLLARSQRRRNPSGATLNTTALVHEAYLRLVQQDGGWEGRGHFFRVAARAMRHILIDYARERRALKRGGPQADVSLDAVAGDGAAPVERLPFALTEAQADEILEVHAALERLAERDERMATVVEMRYFAGFTIDETAAIMDLSPATVKREWATARAWLRTELGRTA